VHTMNDALNDVIGRELDRRLATALVSKLAAQGIAFSETQSDALVTALHSGDHEAVDACFAHLDGDGVVDLHLAGEQFDAIEADLLEHLSGLADLSARLAGETLSRLDATWERQRRRENRQRAGFEKRLNRQWADGLDSLEMLIVMAREFGSGLGDDADDTFRESVKFGVLLRLHARACQISTEVLTLLRAGLADGAMARWRSLHEVATVSLVISEGNEDLAERYAAHDAIESYKAMGEYIRYQDRLDVEPVEQAELASSAERRAELIRKYGREYANQYGWACCVTKSARPGFADIERAAGIDHLKAYYRLASHNVHANPKGVFFKLGLVDESDILLAGSSNAGLSDPGQCTAISLVQASAHFAVLFPSLDNLVVAQLLQLMVDRVCAGFSQAHESLHSPVEPMREPQSH